MSEERAKCPHCGGKGFKLVKILIWVGEQRCGWCKGTGEIAKAPPIADRTAFDCSALLAELEAARRHARNTQDIEANGRCNLTVLVACDAAVDAINDALKAERSHSANESSSATAGGSAL